MSSPSPEADFGRSLVAKSREDLDALVALHERDGIADSVLGFHAQQAVEKALKGLLVSAGWELRHTHDLRFLVQQAESLNLQLPEATAEAHWLTPWAVELRYDEFSTETLDRDRALATASEAVQLAEGQFAG